MLSYEQLLKRAEEKIDREKEAVSRFKMPEASIENQGSNTYISNITELAKDFRRELQHLVKFLLREMAVPGELQGSRLLLQGKFSKEQIGKKIELYAKEFVICASCGKPDTNLISEEGLAKIRCEACTSKRVVRSLK